MRIRSIKPEFWRSDDIDALSIPDRLLFIGLWSYVDDSGVGVDREASIAADLFAGDLSREPQETSVRVHGGLMRLASAGLITRYAADGKRWLHITNWTKHQKINRPTDSRRPQPTSENAEPSPLDTDDSLSPHADSPFGTGEQGSKETTSSSDTAAPRPDKPKKPEPKRDDVEAVCTRLRDLIIENGSKAPTITQEWRRQARLMLDSDKRDLSKALNLIEWCQKDTFWQSNILSMPKFRQQYDQLALKAREEWRRRGEQQAIPQVDLDKNPWAGQRYV